MLPSKRGDVGEEIVGDICSLRAQLPDGTVEIDRVPVNDGGGDEAEARRAEALVLEGAISNFSLAVEEHRAPQRVTCLALVGLSVIWLQKMSLRKASKINMVCAG